MTPFPLRYTKDMSDDECIMLCLLRGIEPRLYMAQHQSRGHPVWYLRNVSVDGWLETEVERWINSLTRTSTEPRCYFISRAEACRAACEFYGWSFYEVTP